MTSLVYLLMFLVYPKFFSHQAGTRCGCILAKLEFRRVWHSPINSHSHIHQIAQILSKLLKLSNFKLCSIIINYITFYFSIKITSYGKYRTWTIIFPIVQCKFLTRYRTLMVRYLRRPFPVLV